MPIFIKPKSYEPTQINCPICGPLFWHDHLASCCFRQAISQHSKALCGKRKQALERRSRAKSQQENLNGFRQTVCYQQLQLVLQAYNDQIHHALV